jgi:hypothetical protein
MHRTSNLPDGRELSVEEFLARDHPISWGAGKNVSI